MKTGAPFSGDIVYILRDYPVPSERFIDREIRALRQLGTPLSIVTLLPDRGAGSRTGAGAAKVLADLPILRRPSWGAPRLWMAALRASIRNPTKVAYLIGLAWTAGSAKRSWGRLLGLRWVLLALFFASRLHHRQIALIHAHFASAPATLALLLARWMEVPWGFSCHASDIYAEAVHLRFKAQRAKHLIACSKRLAEDIRGRLPRALHSRVHTVHHGLNLKQWKPADPPPDPNPEPRILAVGRFVPKKGFEILLAACALLRDDGLRFCCQLIGAGLEQENLERSIAARGLGAQVKITPWKSPAALRQAYTRASVMVIPSIITDDGNRDNIPNVALEALACEVPVIASALPGMEQILGASQAGLLVPPGDPRALAEAIREICSDPQLRQGLRKHGRRLVERQFDQAVNACQLQSLLADSASQEWWTTSNNGTNSTCSTAWWWNLR